MANRMMQKVLAAVGGLLLVAGAAQSQAEEALTARQQAQVKQEVRKELKRLLEEEGFLDQAIQKGIDSYVRRQRAKARAAEDQTRGTKAVNVRPVDPKVDHIFGNPDAEITLVEYSDFECPFCKRYHPTVKKLIEQNKGKVNWVYRHFPLEFHNPGAQKEAEASECAAEIGGNEMFWKYSDQIHARTTSNGNGFPIENLVPLALELGLDEAAFKSCLESGRMAARVKQDYDNGVAAGVTGTPGSILIKHATGDIFPASGAIPLERLQALIDEMLK